MKVKVLGYTYNVTEHSDAEIGVFGRMRAKVQSLQIAYDLCEEQKVSTLLHEILEAINFHLELDLPHKTIAALETSLYQTLVDNGIDLSPLLEEKNA